MFFGQHTIFHVRTPGIVGSNQKNSTSIIYLKLSGTMKILKLNAIFQAPGFFQSAQNVWAKMKIFLQFF
jgi:hypothetical protein